MTTTASTRTCKTNKNGKLTKSRTSTSKDLMETNKFLAWSSERFAELFQELPVICFCFDSNGIVYEWNRACERESGFKAKEVIQLPFWQTFCRREDEAALRQMTADVCSGKRFSDIEMTFVRSDASTYRVINSTFPLRSHDGSIVGAISASINIEQRKLIETELIDSQERLKLAMEVARLRIWEWDLREDLFRFTESKSGRITFGERTCLPSSEYLAKVHPADLPAALEAVDEAKKAHTPVEVQYRTILDDGSIAWNISRAIFVYDENGEAIKLVGSALDITAAKEAELQLRHAQEMLELRVAKRTAELSEVNDALKAEIAERTRAESDLKLHSDIVHHMKTGVVVFHLEDENDYYSFRQSLVNEAARQHGLKEYRKEVGLYIRDVFTPDVLPQMVEMMSGVLRTGEPFDDEKIIYAEDGSIIHAVEARIFPLPNQSVGVTLENVTRRRRAELELQRAHTQNAHMLASIGSILICLDESNRVISWNTMADQIFGTEKGQTIGLKFTDVQISWDWDPIVMGIYECRNTNSPVRLDDLRYTNSDGKERFLGLTINPLRDEKDVPSGYLILGTDITKRRVLESQLAQSQKLESIGSLAAGISHEINTPIQYVGDNTRFLNDAFRDMARVVAVCKEIVDAPGATENGGTVVSRLKEVIEETDMEYLMQEIPAAIEQSLDGVGRVAHIVRAMKEFSHPGQEEMTTIDLNHAIDSTVTVARNEWKYVADVITDFGEDLPPLPCYPGIFNQVILNMIINASHAIADVIAGSNAKGTIAISTRAVHGYAEIRISDSGTGIPQEILGRIFDPFFTTKPVGRGTGQGLAISHTVIVEKHRGTIDVETKVGKGTSFIIKLPLVRKGC